MPRPSTKKQVRSLLGLINFYRRYIPDCATLISPLTDLTRSSAPNRVEWGDKQEAAFTKVKEVLSKKKQFWSCQTWTRSSFSRQTLSMSGSEPACYSSMKGLNTPSSTPVKSYLGENVITRLVNVRRWPLFGQFSKCIGFLYGQHFVLETDHRPLQYLNSAHSKSPRLMRWSLALQPYHFTIRYIRGEDSFCADYLSRGCAADT